MKEYLVSGVSGFLASNLVQRLEPAQVFKLNRTGLIDRKYDTIFDFASYGNYHHQKDIQEIYRANIIRVLNLMSTSQGSDIVLTSTSAINLPTQTHYTVSKHSMEQMAKLYAREHNQNIVIIRPSSITGKGEQQEHLIPTLIKHAKSGEPMNFVPTPTHDFLDVDDFINGVLIVLKNIKSLSGNVVNISRGKSYTNEEVKDLVQLIMNKKINLNYVNNLRSYDSTRWTVDNELLKSFGWKPKKSLRDTIKEMI